MRIFQKAGQTKDYYSWHWYARFDYIQKQGLVQVSNTKALEGNKPVKSDIRRQSLGYEIKIANDADCLALIRSNVDGAGTEYQKCLCCNS